MSGRWTVALYGSGTHIVKREGVRAPHFYVYEAPGLSRYETCEQLAAWLNGEASRPAWADSLIRSSETNAYFPALNEHGTPLPIYTTGPYVESEAGLGDWTEDPDSDRRDERARLMDMLTRADTPRSGGPRE